MAGSGVQEDVGCVHPAHPDQTHAVSATAVNRVTVCLLALKHSDSLHLYPDLLLMCMKGGKSETLSLIFSKKLALFQPDVVDLIGCTPPVRALPLVDGASTPSLDRDG